MKKINFNKYRFKKYSQHEEDGITLKIIDAIKPKNKVCVEIGVESGKECCSKILWKERGFKQVLFDNNHKNFLINLQKVTVTVDNVLKLLQDNHVPQDVDFLGVDIDSYDFYIVHKILERYYPRLLVVEGHPIYLKEDKVVKLNHPLKGSYNGASFKAWYESLKDRYDYVSLEEQGINAYFVKKGLLDERQVEHMNDFEKLYRKHPRINQYPPIPKNYPYVTHKEALKLLHNNVDITAVISGICPPERLKFLKRTVDYMDKQQFPFIKKIIIIDEFNGNTFPLKLKDYFEMKGWIVLIDHHKSRVKSLEHAFSLINSKYIFYNEDDMEVTLPKPSDIVNLFNKKIQNRNCGIVSLNLGGSSNHFPDNQYGDLDMVKDNILLKRKDYLAFLRLEEKKNDWFIELPGLFIRTDLFKLCNNTAKKKFAGYHIEIALSKAWFYENLDKTYFKCSFARPSILDIVSKSPLKIYIKSRLIKFIDPLQSKRSFGGGQDYQNTTTIIKTTLRNVIRHIKTALLRS